MCAAVPQSAVEQHLAKAEEETAAVSAKVFQAICVALSSYTDHNYILFLLFFFFFIIVIIVIIIYVIIITIYL